MTRVLIAEDQHLVREGIASMLRSGGFEVVAEVADGVEAVAAAARTRPDVALLDIRMPRLDGIAATEQILAAVPETRVLVLTTFGSDDLVLAALGTGAGGFLLKDARPEDLLDAVAALARGESRLDPVVTRAVVEHVRRRTRVVAAMPPAGELTDREREVLLLLARGLSNAEIGAELFIASGTVKTHVATILAKLGVRDRLQAAVWAYRTGLAEG